MYVEKKRGHLHLLRSVSRLQKHTTEEPPKIQQYADLSTKKCTAESGLFLCKISLALLDILFGRTFKDSQRISFSLSKHSNWPRSLGNSSRYIQRISSRDLRCFNIQMLSGRLLMYTEQKLSFCKHTNWPRSLGNSSREEIFERLRYFRFFIMRSIDPKVSFSKRTNRSKSLGNSLRRQESSSRDLRCFNIQMLSGRHLMRVVPKLSFSKHTNWPRSLGNSSRY
ncbi:hypothetical protein LXL04_010583 [Taraxacum kok-saghyz]